jgi:hypothetical protein
MGTSVCLYTTPPPRNNDPLLFVACRGRFCPVLGHKLRILGLTLIVRKHHLQYRRSGLTSACTHFERHRLSFSRIRCPAGTVYGKPGCRQTFRTRHARDASVNRCDRQHCGEDPCRNLSSHHKPRRPSRPISPELIKRQQSSTRTRLATRVLMSLGVRHSLAKCNQATATY